MRIFYVHHRAGGVLWQHPFAAEPTDEQVSAALAWGCRTFGVCDKPLLKIVSVEVHGVDLPQVPPPKVAPENTADADAPRPSGSGIVGEAQVPSPKVAPENTAASNAPVPSGSGTVG